MADDEAADGVAAMRRVVTRQWVSHFSSFHSSVVGEGHPDVGDLVAIGCPTGGQGLRGRYLVLVTVMAGLVDGCAFGCVEMRIAAARVLRKKMKLQAKLQFGPCKF